LGCIGNWLRQNRDVSKALSSKFGGDGRINDDEGCRFQIWLNLSGV